ncbi:hypothetical protein KIPB_007263 [Kipferlia bialata]|uniref:Uncharacterized protein n=1 Tax=Kipferlia bialata TaxID=797122 RepID=A0A9K3GIX3_9EUKA|nr:hypothetical protein KIPB_007263 [Kipferlia bialata]|eukprot:g7263.t1
MEHTRDMSGGSPKKPHLTVGTRRSAPNGPLVDLVLHQYTSGQMSGYDLFKPHVMRAVYSLVLNYSDPADEAVLYGALQLLTIACNHGSLYDAPPLFRALSALLDQPLSAIGRHRVLLLLREVSRLPHLNAVLWGTERLLLGTCKVLTTEKGALIRSTALDTLTLALTHAADTHSGDKRIVTEIACSTGLLATAAGSRGTADPSQGIAMTALETCALAVNSLTDPGEALTSVLDTCGPSLLSVLGKAMSVSPQSAQVALSLLSVCGTGDRDRDAVMRALCNDPTVVRGLCDCAMRGDYMQVQGSISVLSACVSVLGDASYEPLLQCPTFLPAILSVLDRREREGEGEREVDPEGERELVRMAASLLLMLSDSEDVRLDIGGAGMAERIFAPLERLLARETSPDREREREREGAEGGAGLVSPIVHIVQRLAFDASNRAELATCHRLLRLIMSFVSMGTLTAPRPQGLPSDSPSPGRDLCLTALTVCQSVSFSGRDAALFLVGEGYPLRLAEILTCSDASAVKIAASTLWNIVSTPEARAAVAGLPSVVLSLSAPLTMADDTEDGHASRLAMCNALWHLSAEKAARHALCTNHALLTAIRDIVQGAAGAMVTGGYDMQLLGAVASSLLNLTREASLLPQLMGEGHGDTDTLPMAPDSASLPAVVVSALAARVGGTGSAPVDKALTRCLALYAAYEGKAGQGVSKLPGVLHAIENILRAQGQSGGPPDLAARCAALDALARPCLPCT